MPSAHVVEWHFTIENETWITKYNSISDKIGFQRWFTKQIGAWIMSVSENVGYIIDDPGMVSKEERRKGYVKNLPHQLLEGKAMTMPYSTVM